MMKLIFMILFAFTFSVVASSLLIVYEGFEEMKEHESPTTISVDVEQNETSNEHLKPMEDDSHSGNCSYDADASNDSIELNLSLDEHEHEQFYHQVIFD